jgi:hypothetical protein
VQQERLAKAQHSDARKLDVCSAVRVQQHTALLLMRQLRDIADEPDAPVAIDYMNLAEREFVELTVLQQKQLLRAISVLRLLLQDNLSSTAQMRGALNDAEFIEYEKSFDSAVSHIEDVWENRPDEIDEYLRLIKLGDLLTGASERIARRARTSARGVKYTRQGHTTAASVWYKAEKHYESALMYLQGQCESAITAAQLQQWFDRELDFEPESGTLSASAIGVPRLRGSRSHYCLDKTQNLWGVKKSKFYRQREAISDAVYAMLFADDEESKQNKTVVSAKLQKLLQQIHPEQDWD